MTHLREVLDRFTLSRMIDDGYVRTQYHPTEPLVIYNYTEKAQYENVWNDVTRKCRGLIVHRDTNEVVARPFTKFFNYGQPQASEMPVSVPVTVTDKMDGSLGILYPTPGLTPTGWSIATRGSFVSEQAVHATELFNRKYASRWVPTPGYTFLFEIVYPDNRIVLDYHGLDDLVLIGAVNMVTGWSIPRIGFWSKWPGPVAEEFTYGTLTEALMAEPRENAEGLVVHFLASDERVKIKQDDYVALHRVLTNTSARTVWTYLAVNACKGHPMIKQPKHWGTYVGVDPKRAAEIMAVGDDWMEKLLAGVPDEFYDWLSKTKSRLENEVEETRKTLSVMMRSYVDSAQTNGKFDRRRFWELMSDETPENRGMMMALWDGHDITPQLWKVVYPGVELPFKKISEDVA